MSYISYGSKSEELKHYYKEKIRPSTIYYSEITSFWKDYQELIERQKAENKRLGIKLSKHFDYDEQYVFVNKKLYLRMTIIDIINKLIIAEQLVSEEEFNDETIKKFLEDNIDQETVESITTDGRKSYKTIIQAVGALHHRCFFHLMQNLMMPLTRHINKIKRNIQKGENTINKNNKEIEERKQRYPKIRGRIPKKDTKKQKNRDKILELEKENKKIRQEICKHKAELKTIEQEKERIQNIFKSKTQKQAR